LPVVLGMEDATNHGVEFRRCPGAYRVAPRGRPKRHRDASGASGQIEARRNFRHHPRAVAARVRDARAHVLGERGRSVSFALRLGLRRAPEVRLDAIVGAHPAGRRLDPRHQTAAHLQHSGVVVQRRPVGALHRATQRDPEHRKRVVGSGRRPGRIREGPPGGLLRIRDVP
jgi:hypothetical protein